TAAASVYLIRSRWHPLNQANLLLFVVLFLAMILMCRKMWTILFKFNNVTIYKEYDRSKILFTVRQSVTITKTIKKKMMVSTNNNGNNNTTPATTSTTSLDDITAIKHNNGKMNKFDVDASLAFSLDSYSYFKACSSHLGLEHF
ncbi:hypothetical protein RFI_32484, partial [Reticulomyxa filosa]